MGLIVYLVALALIGLVVGALARLALPGRDPMSIPQTIIIGVIGSLAAGLLLYFVLGRESNYGFALAVAVSTGLVYLVRRRRGGTLTDPGLGARR